MQEVIVTNIETSSKTLTIYAELERKPHSCIACGKVTDAIYDYHIQRIKDIPTFGKLVTIVLRKRRYCCSHCDKSLLENNSFSSPLTNGFTEGCNNKIKVLKRNAYGYKNLNRLRKHILHIFSHHSLRNKQAAA